MATIALLSRTRALLTAAAAAPLHHLTRTAVAPALARPAVALLPAAPPAPSCAPSALPAPSLARTMRVRSSLRLICDQCRFVKRKRVLFVICKREKRHKQRQG